MQANGKIHSNIGANQNFQVHTNTAFQIRESHLLSATTFLI
jgi:hypothetical protein